MRNDDPLVGCRLLVAISAHYAPERIPVLLDVLRALADLPLPRLDVKVMVNELDADTLKRHQHLISCQFGVHATAEVLPHGNLGHPFDLTWTHKALIRDCFLAPGTPWTHFLYLEDDIRFSLPNLRYFLRMRPVLAPHGLIPSFLRTEYSHDGRNIRFLDQISLLDPATAPQLEAGGIRFVQPENPYCASFLLDTELAREHIAGRSSDPGRSREICSWRVRERAGAGLCWENPPTGFKSRFVVPFDPASGAVPAECWVPHLAARYADNRRSRFGKLPVPSLLIPPVGVVETITVNKS